MLADSWLRDTEGAGGGGEAAQLSHPDENP
jgi:hypothetical protein